MSVEVRSAIAADEAACLDLVLQLKSMGEENAEPEPGWGDMYRQLVEGDRGAIHLAEEDGQILGAVTTSYNLAIRYGTEYCQLEELIVSQAARGKSVGRLLLDAAIDAARARGCTEMGLYLLSHTEHNRPFYEKFGFEVIGTEMRMPLP